MSAITCDHGDLPAPTPHFSTLVANKRLSPIDAWVNLAWPLGGAWVTQGSPNPKPNPKGTHSRAGFARGWAESQSAEGRKRLPAYLKASG